MSSDLRKKAEVLLKQNPFDIPEVSTVDMQKLVHEFQVYQVELEMQNEALRETQVQLGNARDNYVELYDFAPVGYLTLDAEERIIEANFTAAALLGMERGKLLEGHRFAGFVDRKSLDEWNLHPQCEKEFPDKFGRDLVLQRRDGSRFNVHVECVSRPGTDLERGRILITLLDITERVQAEEALRKNEKELTRLNCGLEQIVQEQTGDLRKLASELSLAAQLERQHIAASLHDSLGQQLSSANLRLDMLRTSPLPEAATAALTTICEIIQQTLSQTRSLTFELSCPMLKELGLAAALEELCSTMTHEQSVVFRFEGNVQQLPLHMDRKVVLYRFVRELLINVMKHAEAKQAAVLLERIGDTMQLSVEDDGRGFDAAMAGKGFSPGGGFGLFNIREYVQHIGGNLEIGSIPGTGTKVVLTVPLEVGHG